MAGLFPAISGAQNVDLNGRPLANAVLTVYVGGTTTLASVYQDIGLAVPGPNPMTADLTGRLAYFYVPDGTYKVTLVDQFGVQVYTYPQVASIGASSSGGGGSAVDPTTIFQTGDDLWQEIGTPRTGWVRENGLTIGSAVSGASERANADCQNLFLFLWNNYSDTKCPVVGGRGGSASADWAANKQITLPDKRGLGPHGKDGMGNTRANIIPDSVVTSAGDTGDTDGATGGAALPTIAQGNLPNVDFAINLTAQPQTVDINGGAGATVGGSQAGVANGGSFIAVTAPKALTLLNTSSAVTGTVNSGGSGTAFNVMNPFVLGTWFKKL